MTEEAWLACTDPYAMSEWLYMTGKADRRRLGLFFAACCSRIRASPAEEASRRAGYGLWLANTYHQDDALTNARFHILCAVKEAIHVIGSGAGEHAALAALLRDI